MFSKHYQSELAFLRGMGKEFAAAHPSAAGLLAERGGDPDVERLLEGFAFLAARIRERLDDAVPEIVHDLTEILAPQYLRPVPSSTVVEFQPAPGALRARAKVPAGSELASIPVEGVPCRFRVASDLDLVPVTVTEAALDQAIGATPTLRLQIRAAAPALPAVFQDEGIRFFVQGEMPLATTVLLWLARHLGDVAVKGLGSGRTIRLGPRAVRMVGLDPAFALFPWPGIAPAGYRVLQEYFTLPQKFLFFEVVGLGAAKEVAEEQFEISLQFARPPELPARLGRDNFRVNCAPVVNLFAAEGEPIRVTAPGEEHLVRAAAMEPRHVEVHSIESVKGQPDARGDRRTYHPFSGFGFGPEGADARYYRLRRRHSILDGGVDTYLSLGTPRDGGTGPADETLSLALTCTNRSLPGQLGLGDVSVATQTSPTVARFKNILPVTKPIRPPLGSELHWRLVAHLAANRAPLPRGETLRALLDVYNFPALVDQQSGRANRLRIEGIQAAEGRPARRVVGGAPVRGTRVSLELDESHYASPGDAFLFAAVLDELLGSQVALNSFTELAVRLQPSGREYAWTPRNGNRSLL